jgi:hypothetical protein
LAEGGRGRVEASLAGGLVQLEDGTVVRLAGVDVPGRGEPGWVEARAALAKAVDGREVSLLHSGPRRDGFDRAVAHLRTVSGRRWVQGALLDAGMARVRTTPSDRALAREMLDREARARIAGRGLWATSDWRVRLPAEIEPGFNLVEGRLESSGRRLRFVRSELVVSVSARARTDLAAAGVSPNELSQGVVRIRGVVRQEGAGLTLVVDHPEQIEILSRPAPQSRGVPGARQ